MCLYCLIDTNKENVNYEEIKIITVRNTFPLV